MSAPLQRVYEPSARVCILVRQRSLNICLIRLFPHSAFERSAYDGDGGLRRAYAYVMRSCAAPADVRHVTAAVQQEADAMRRYRYMLLMVMSLPRVNSDVYDMSRQDRSFRFVDMRCPDALMTPARCAAVIR